MRVLFAAAVLVTGLAALSPAEGTVESTNGGRYQMFANPHANRVYVLDTQSGRVFQLANYKDIGKEIMEEVPYLYGSNKLCTPTDFERSPDKCFSRNYEYLKSLMDLKREQIPTPPPAGNPPPK